MFRLRLCSPRTKNRVLGEPCIYRARPTSGKSALIRVPGNARDPSAHTSKCPLVAVIHEIVLELHSKSKLGGERNPHGSAWTEKIAQRPGRHT